MRHRIVTSVALALFATTSLTAQPTYAAASGAKAQVEFELMTWPEVKDALAAGKTTALIYTGGVEQRGPQNVNGGHNITGSRDRQGDCVAPGKRDRDAGVTSDSEQCERRASWDHWLDA